MEKGIRIALFVALLACVAPGWAQESALHLHETPAAWKIEQLAHAPIGMPGAKITEFRADPGTRHLLAYVVRPAKRRSWLLRLLTSPPDPQGQGAWMTVAGMDGLATVALKVAADGTLATGPDPGGPVTQCSGACVVIGGMNGLQPVALKVGADGTVAVSGGGLSASQATNVTYVTDPAYGVNVQNQLVVNDATWSAVATPTLTTTGTDPAQTAAMNNNDCWGLVAGVVVLPVGTYTNLSSTTGTCSSTATSPAAGNGVLAILVNNNAAMHSAGTAFAAKCGTFEMPAGYIEITATDFIPAQPAKCFLTPSFLSGWHIRGQGHMATWIIPRPGTTYVNTGSGCFASGLNMQLTNFSIQGLGQTLSGINTNCPAFLQLSQASHMDSVGIFSLGSAATNTPRPLNFSSQGGKVTNFYVDFGPGGGILCAGPQGSIESSYNSDLPAGAIALEVSNSVCFSRGNRWDCAASNGTAIQLDANGFIDSVDDYSGTGTNCVQLRMNGAGAYAKVDGLNKGFVTATCGASNCYGVLGAVAGWTVNAINSVIPGSATNGYINANATGTFADMGGNTYFGSVITPANLTMHGTGSVQAQVIGNIVASACGTSTNGTLAAGSTNLHAQFTMTVAGGPITSCVETVTFPTNSFAVAPLCVMTDIGGTGAFPTSIVNGTISATSAAFTITSASLANGATEIFQVNCNYP